MTKRPKRIDALRIADLVTYPVWQFANTEHGDEALADETFVRPIAGIPVSTSIGKVVGTQVMLANGLRTWALIGNFDISDPLITEHFITLSFEHGGRWFSLSRYHDFDYAEKGPDALADFLDHHVDEVFPIVYDIRPYVRGNAAALSGQIEREPRLRLSRTELISLSIPRKNEDQST